jgi:preprotein translocase subunit SecG
MFTFFIVLITIIGLLMTLVVLLQSGQGGGLAGIASGGAAQQVLGTRQSPDTLEKATWTLGTLFIALCLLSNFFIDRGPQESVIQQRAQQGQTQQQQPLPAPGNQQGAQPLPAPSEGGGGNQGGGSSGN